MESLGINLSFLVVQIFNFLIVFVVLAGWVYKPVTNMLKTRREKIAQGLEDARIAAEARKNAEKEAEEIIAQAQQEASQIVRDATARAEEAGREVREAAEREAAIIRENALADAEQEKTRILGELRGQVAALAIAAAQKVVGEALDEKRQRELIESFFSGVKDGKVVLLEEGDLVAGNKAVVTSALPLTDDEKAVIKKEIAARLGEDVEVDFAVDPNILGGIVIRVGDKVLDGSVAGKLEGLRQSLQ